MQRESWMTTPPAGGLLASRQQQQAEAPSEDKDRTNVLEPPMGYYQPPKKTDRPEDGHRGGSNDGHRGSGSGGSRGSSSRDERPPPKITVGDGGASWRAKARLRAAESGISLEPHSRPSSSSRVKETSFTHSRLGGMHHPADRQHDRRGGDDWRERRRSEKESGGRADRGSGREGWRASDSANSPHDKGAVRMSRDIRGAGGDDGGAAAGPSGRAVWDRSTDVRAGGAADKPARVGQPGPASSEKPVPGLSSLAGESARVRHEPGDGRGSSQASTGGAASTQTGSQAAAAAAVDVGEARNKLAARLMKAQLKGNKDLEAKIRAEMAALESTGGAAAPVSSKPKYEDTTIVLSGLNEKGLPMNLPLSFGKNPSRAHYSDLMKQIDAEKNQEARRNDMSVHELMVDEKYTDSNSYDAEFGRTIAKNRAFTGNTEDDFDSIDLVAAQMGKKRKRMSLQQISAQNKQRAVQAEMRARAHLNRCNFCVDSERFQHHLVVSVGKNVYLALPASGMMTTGHCMLFPTSHSPSTTNIDEDTYRELQSFKQCLMRMAASLGRVCVFLEVVPDLHSKRHTYVECIPIPENMEIDACLYYKKALLESGSEWSNHKKLIDTHTGQHTNKAEHTGPQSMRRGVKSCIPDNFPYFHVEVGDAAGYAQVIEKNDFPPHFGREIVGGLLDLSPEHWRHPPRLPRDRQVAQVKQLKDLWEPYNWTEYSTDGQAE